MISRLYGHDSHYFKMFQSVVEKPNFNLMHCNFHSHVADIVGILKGVQHEIQNGLLINFRSLTQAEIFQISLKWPNIFLVRATRMLPRYCWVLSSRTLCGKLQTQTE